MGYLAMKLEELDNRKRYDAITSTLAKKKKKREIHTYGPNLLQNVLSSLHLASKL
jgi:hypothetical protein